MIAAIAPGVAAAAAAVARPRSRVRCAAVRSSIEPAAASAAYSPTEWPTTKSGCKPGVGQAGEAGELGRHERRLGDVGLAEALDRALEAELRRGRTRRPPLRARRRLARPERPRSSHAPYPPPGNPVPGSRTPPCPPSRDLLAATADQTTPEPETRAPAPRRASQASVNPNESCASSTLSPLQCTIPVPRPNVAAQAVDGQLEVEDVAGPDDAAEAHAVDAREQRHAAEEVGMREHAHRAGLRERLDHEHAGHDRVAREVARAGTTRRRAPSSARRRGRRARARRSRRSAGTGRGAGSAARSARGRMGR